MRVLLQRVSRAAVRVEGKTVGSIGEGVLLFVGFAEADGPSELEWMVEKVIDLRVFNDGDGKMNRSLKEAGGAILAVSQFTLYGDARKGRRPSFARAAKPEKAASLYSEFVAFLRRRAPGVVAEGVFGAALEVDLVNVGPVTLLLERCAGSDWDPEREVGWS
jgi:D-tyrosyl-tRNA(Tyr) deacylase